MLFHLCNSKRPCDENLKVVSHVHIKVALENSIFFHNDAGTSSDVCRLLIDLSVR